MALERSAYGPASTHHEQSQRGKTPAIEVTERKVLAQMRGTRHTQSVGMFAGSVRSSSGLRGVWWTIELAQLGGPPRVAYDCAYGRGVSDWKAVHVGGFRFLKRSSHRREPQRPAMA